MKPVSLRIALGAEQSVSALLDAPASPAACLVLAHGAGAGMQHSFMAAAAAGLTGRGIAVLRYQFAYMERGSKRPDAPALAHAAVRAAVAEAAKRLHGMPLFAGGKSFGARMTSQAQSETPLPGVRGLVFLGFPLHPSGKPGITRAEHLAQVKIPMLFLQGDKDKLAELALLRPVVKKLGKAATLHVEEHADHSFHVPVKSGKTDAQVLDTILDEAAAWMKRQ